MNAYCVRLMQVLNYVRMLMLNQDGDVEQMTSALHLFFPDINTVINTVSINQYLVIATCLS